MISDPNEYFSDGCGRCSKFRTLDCKVHIWREGLSTLREICLGKGLVEEAKWGHPCYTLNGKNVVILGAFKEDFHLSFFKASLMKDPDGLLTKRGKHTQTNSIFSFTDNAAPNAQRDAISRYLDEAIEIENSGQKPIKKTVNFEIPQELLQAMDDDPELAEAFNALTPGRQRGYCMTIGDAKQSQTRINRIAKYRDKILAGRGFNER